MIKEMGELFLDIQEIKITTNNTAANKKRCMQA